MNSKSLGPGQLMASEIAQAPEVFASTVLADQSETLSNLDLGALQAIYTVARGSSDAVANILSYLFMSHLKIPVTSLPPSTFSVYRGVKMKGSAGLVISQSGASDDLVACAVGIKVSGGVVIALTNQPGSPVEKSADVTIPINAGPELAVPATKSVIGSIAGGMSLLAASDSVYRDRASAAAVAMKSLATKEFPEIQNLQSGLMRASHVYVVGRGAGFGVAQEVALKLKETSALHAEAYSASEVLHGPLQLAKNPLFIILLNTGEPESQASLDEAEYRFHEAGGEVLRIAAPMGGDHCPTAAAAMLLYMIYPVVLKTALAMGFDPDRPSTLSKITKTL